MALVGTADHPGWHRPSGSVVLKHQHVPRWQPRPWAFTWPSMITGTVGINTDPGCHKATDTGMVLVCGSGPMPPWSFSIVLNLSF